MKTKVSLISRLVMMAVALLMTTTIVLADGETTDMYTSGTSISEAGNFVVRTTNDIFHFQGQEYEVYKVYYDNPAMNLKIAVNAEGKCKSFIAYTKEYTMFYDCTKNGFGVRKVMFSNPDAHKAFNHEKFQEQTVLRSKRRIDKKQAVELIACFLPGMQTA